MLEKCCFRKRLMLWRFADAVDVTPVLNGLLSGLVASSSTSSYVSPYASLVIGFVAGCSYMGFSKSMLKFRCVSTH
eukprot:scaffold427692_cov47-Prasinocladus_malaysianus.AAC.1